LQKAHDEGLDLVEIGPSANPPVCKILDFEKFKYEKTRQEKEAKKKIKEIELKEVRFGPFVSEHDLNFRLEKAKEFLKKGNKVKLTINFTGRQMRHTEFGDQLLNRIMEQLGESVQVDQEKRFAGRQLSIVVGPKK
jgi:translation initiation factor IF-3